MLPPVIILELVYKESPKAFVSKLFSPNILLTDVISAVPSFVHTVVGILSIKPFSKSNADVVCSFTETSGTSGLPGSLTTSL